MPAAFLGLGILHHAHHIGDLVLEGQHMVADALADAVVQRNQRGCRTPVDCNVPVIELDIRSRQGQGEREGIHRGFDSQTDSHGHICHTVFVDGGIDLDTGCGTVRPGGDSQAQHQTNTQGQRKNSAFQANPSFTLYF